MDDKKRVAVLSLEMVMSYMIAFKSLNQARSIEHKVGDFRVWEEVVPHLHELRNHTRPFRPLEGLALQLHAVCLEQLVEAYCTYDLAVAGVKLLSVSKKRPDAWSEAHRCLDRIGDSSMKVTLGPWSGVEDAIRAALPIVRRWADREEVAWEQQFSLSAMGA
jgi:hypothetical protein